MSVPIILIVAGEASADLHGAHVLRALRAQRPDVQAFGIGGKALQAEGLEAAADAEDISVAGLTEVLIAIPPYRRYLAPTDAAWRRAPACCGASARPARL